MGPGNMSLRVFRVVNIEHGCMPLWIARRRFLLVNECRILLLLNGHTPPLLGKIVQHLFCNHKGKNGGRVKFFLTPPGRPYP